MQFFRANILLNGSKMFRFVLQKLHKSFANQHPRQRPGHPQAGGRASETGSSACPQRSHQLWNPAGGGRIYSTFREAGRGLGTEEPKKAQRHAHEQKQTSPTSRQAEVGEAERGKHGEAEEQQIQRQHS